MNRPTISDLASTAGVSVSTVNRLLHGSGGVRQDTIDQILKAAEDIGFYGLGAIKERRKDALPHYKLGFLLQQSHRQLYQMFGASLEDASRRRRDVYVKPDVRYVDDLSPEAIAENLIQIGRENDAVALIAADHPIIGQAIETLRGSGVPVVAYITDQSAPGRAGYVGTDNWKLGRTAGWFIAETNQGAGKIATFNGNHRYQCQDIADAGFRSYIREHAPQMTVGDTIATQEEPEIAYRIVRDLVAQDPDLVGLFIAGGGISGVLRAMRELSTERRKKLRVVCRDIGPETRKGLTEGLIAAALCHPLERTSAELIDVMVGSVDGPHSSSIVQRIIPFEIVTPESI